MIRAVVVDDEPPARRKLKHLLSLEQDFVVIGEAASAGEAVEILSTDPPEVAFLDVQLPDASGFDVLAALERRDQSQIVFVTAYDEFALKAFEVNAVDYLLKPVEPSRFAASLQRLRRLIESGSVQCSAGRVNELMSGYSRRLLIRDNDRSFFLDVDRIDWVESARNYACIHSGHYTYILRSSLDSLATKLDPAIFRRINRSQLIHAGRIAELKSGLNGDRKVRLRDGTELNWSRRFRSGSLQELERC